MPTVTIPMGIKLQLEAEGDWARVVELLKSHWNRKEGKSAVGYTPEELASCTTASSFIERAFVWTQAGEGWDHWNRKFQKHLAIETPKTSPRST